MGQHRDPVRTEASRRHRIKLLVCRAAGAVPGAAAGAAIAFGAGLSVLLTAVLGGVGAALGAVAAIGDGHGTRPVAGRQLSPPVVAAPGDTPPDGLRLSR